MNEIQKYRDLTPVANQLLRRMQAYHTKILDKTSISLIELFLSTFGEERIKELRNLGDLSLNDANRFMTVQFNIKDIGFNSGKNPSREIERMKEILEIIRDHPYILYETKENGKRIYNDLPLIKYRKVTSDGTCTVIFNDALRYLFFPDKYYGLISLSLLKEISECNIYAGIIYEEACSYAGMRGYKGQNPYFSWSLKEAREKFGFDRMVNFDKDMITYDIQIVKKMRPDVLREKIIKPALSVLEDFYIAGKLEYWLDPEISAGLKSKGAGRPPKDLFRFIFRRQKKIPAKDGQTDSEQLELQFDEYEQIDTLYLIREQLKKIRISDKMINKMMGQLQRNEQSGTPEEVLTTIKNKRSRYDTTKPPKDRVNLILSVLGKEHHLGDPSRFETSCNDNHVYWPDDLEGRIKVMMESVEIKDRASDKYNLSSQEVDLILQGDFYENCKKNNKLKKNWIDAVDYFFNWINKLGIRGPLNTVSYGNKKQPTDSSVRDVVNWLSDLPTDE